MNAYPPTTVVGDIDSCRDTTSERLLTAVTESRELREELHLSLARLRLVAAQYNESVNGFKGITSGWECAATRS